MENVLQAPITSFHYFFPFYELGTSYNQIPLNSSALAKQGLQLFKVVISKVTILLIALQKYQSFL